MTHAFTFHVTITVVQAQGSNMQMCKYRARVFKYKAQSIVSTQMAPTETSTYDCPDTSGQCTVAVKGVAAIIEAHTP